MADDAQNSRLSEPDAIPTVTGPKAILVYAVPDVDPKNPGAAVDSWKVLTKDVDDDSLAQIKAILQIPK